jgi:AAA+ ATPase superfamily predicted ATPase
MLSRASRGFVVAARLARSLASDAKVFFNREKELKQLGTLLRGKGNFLNVQGPPDCGKSALVARALDRLEVVGTASIVRVDLRGNSFNSVPDFAAMLTRRFAPTHRVRDWLNPFLHHERMLFEWCFSHNEIAVVAVGESRRERDPGSREEFSRSGV